MTLQLGRHGFPDEATVMMAIVNRTPDSFYDRGATWEEDKAYERVRLVAEQGAEMVDIGGIKAAPGVEVSEAEERARVVDLVARVHETLPDVVISVDTWRASVGDAVCAAGADVLNDAWGGADPELVDVAAAHRAALVCTHTGGVTPRTRPYRVEYDDVVRAVLDDCLAYAERAVAAGVARDAVMIDPAHDFGKNTFHSLEVTRRLGELVATGWPVLVSLSNKDFVGETLDRPVGERLTGTLAATAVCALAGARVFRVHEVPETRQTVDMVLSIAGRRPPRRAIRGCSDGARDAPGDPPGRVRVTRVVLVPGVLALLPEYAGQVDPVADLRQACLGAVGWLGRDVTVLADAQGARVAERLLADTAELGYSGREDRVPSYLVVANGSARRSERAPGHLDPRAEPFDAALRRWLLERGPLPDLATGRELLAATDGFARLAELGLDLGRCQLDYEDDPFGVQYWVVRWACES